MVSNIPFFTESATTANFVIDTNNSWRCLSIIIGLQIYLLQWFSWALLRKGGEILLLATLQLSPTLAIMPYKEKLIGLVDVSDVLLLGLRGEKPLLRARAWLLYDTI